MGRRTAPTFIVAIVLAVSLAVVFTAAKHAPAPSPEADVRMHRLTRDSDARVLELTYRFTISDISRDSEQVIVWLPLPPSNPRQSVEDFSIEMDWPYTIEIEPEYGNSFLRFDLSGMPLSESGTLAGAVAYRINRKPYSPLEVSGHTVPIPDTRLARFLAPDNMVPVDGNIAKEAARVAGDLEDPILQARQLFDHIVESVAYDKTGDGWGRGDAVRACDVRTGNCTDFHSLFIGEARSIGIPARFVMGLPVPIGKSGGEIAGYHCWAEFYTRENGWIPVDASEASKSRESRDAFFGSLDTDRIEFTIGRDILIPGATAAPLNYVIYPHVEINGRPHDRIDVSFSFVELVES